MSLDYETAVAFISAIPPGRWTSYGDVADAAGNREAALRIGEWLMDSRGSIPFYWRVIYSDGEVPAGFIASAPGLPHNASEARDRLTEEGVVFSGGRASQRCRYRVEEWRAAGCPSGAKAAEAYLVADVEQYVEDELALLPGGLADLRSLAACQQLAADAVAVNRAIIRLSPKEIPAHNRLGRAYQELGLIAHARTEFETVTRLDPGNAIATKRLKELGPAPRDVNPS